jgi:hypothetical protein
MNLPATDDPKQRRHSVYVRGISEEFRRVGERYDIKAGSKQDDRKQSINMN